MYIRTNSVVLAGLKANLVSVEIDVSKGLPAFAIVGLASKSVSEARERVTVAMNASNYEVPPKRILVNLSPAHIKKEGVHLDLPIAAAMISALGYMHVSPELLEEICFIGELSLTGELRPIVGLLPMAIETKQRALRYLIVARGNETEASLILSENNKTEVLAINNLVELKELCETLQEIYYSPKTQIPNSVDKLSRFRVERMQRHCVAAPARTSFSEVIGQAEAKRGLEIAAAGRHHVLMIGPPGCGKSMLAKRFINLLPPLSFDEALELSKIYSISGFLKNNNGLIQERPLRKPHHTTTATALIGGGVPIRPGEVSLAHNGVLFLDELTEFDRYAIEVLRQILEEKEVSLSRGIHACDYPADFTLIAACNPCPCGYLGDIDRACTDSPLQVAKYISKLSGPFLDRIDIHLELSRLSREEMEAIGSSVDNKVDNIMRTNVIRAQEFALSIDGVDLFALDTETREFISEASHQLKLSARSYTKILSIARTIANLAQAENISLEHIAEALQYRSLSWEKYKQEKHSYF